MKSNKVLLSLCTILFLAGIISAFFGFSDQGNRILTCLLLIVSVIYLISGWYIFRGYHPEGHPLLLFIMGYLYAGVFMAFTLASAAWPLAKTFLFIAIAWVVVQTIMVLAIRQKLSLSSLAQFLIEAGLMLIMIAAGLLHLS